MFGECGMTAFGCKEYNPSMPPLPINKETNSSDCNCSWNAAYVRHKFHNFHADINFIWAKT